MSGARSLCSPLLGLVLTVSACAHVEAPPGGPEMRDPLVLTAVRPDSLAVVPQLRGPVVFSFERRLSERGLDDAVQVSPRTSPVAVGHGGRELRVSLRGGWEPGRIYQVTVLPEIQDLWNNRLEAPITHVFSTGPEIPQTRLTGEAVDRITGRPEVAIRVEAIRSADSLVYAARTDSAGSFAFSHLPEGDYLVRAFRDLNRNRALDPFEPRDSAAVGLSEVDTASLRLRVVMPDTTPPAVTAARLQADMVEVQFDDYLDPEQPLTPAQAILLDAAGRSVPVTRLVIGRPPPETAQPPAEQLPAQLLTLEPAAPLAPGAEYRVRIERIRNLVGLEGGGEATFQTPAAAVTDP